jgi:hypothetical protein
VVALGVSGVLCLAPMNNDTNGSHAAMTKNSCKNVIHNSFTVQPKVVTVGMDDPKHIY